MAVETAEDRAALLEDFGDDVVITPAGGSALPAIRAIFDADYVTVTDLGLEREISDDGPMLLCRRADVASVVQGDGIEIQTGEGAGLYTVSDTRPAWGDKAFTRLILDEGPAV